MNKTIVTDLIWELQRMIDINSDWEKAIVTPTCKGIQLVIYDVYGDPVNTKNIDLI